MQSVFLLLVLFLGIGLIARRYNKWARLSLIAFIIMMIIYVNVTGG